MNSQDTKTKSVIIKITDDFELLRRQGGIEYAQMNVGTTQVATILPQSIYAYTDKWNFHPSVFEIILER